MVDDKKELLELVGLLIQTAAAMVSLAEKMTYKQKEPENTANASGRTGGGGKLPSSFAILPFAN